MHIAIVGPANPEEFAADLQSVDVFPTGMGGRPVNALVRSLLDLGHEVTLFTCTPGGHTTWTATGPSLRIVAVPFRRRAKHRALDFFREERLALAHELKKCDADIFHAHWTYEFALACIGAKVGPLVVTAHDAPWTILRHMPDPYRLIRTIMAVRARASIKNLTVVSPYLGLRWRKEMLYTRPAAVISNAVPHLDVERSAVASKHPIILTVGDASVWKNIKALLAAFVLVRVQFPDSEMRVVGDGLENSGSIALWARTQALDAGVSFLGSLGRSEISQQYTEATLFCHPSLEESQGMALLEAMSAGIPIVAGNNSGAVAWTLFDGEAGILTDVRLPTRIADSIIGLIRSPGEAQQLADRAKELVWTRFSPDAVVKAYLLEYQRLIQESN